MKIVWPKRNDSGLDDYGISPLVIAKYGGMAIAIVIVVMPMTCVPFTISMASSIVIIVISTMLITVYGVVASVLLLINKLAMICLCISMSVMLSYR